MRQKVNKKTDICAFVCYNNSVRQNCIQEVSIKEKVLSYKEGRAL